MHLHVAELGLKKGGNILGITKKVTMHCKLINSVVKDLIKPIPKILQGTFCFSNISQVTLPQVNV